MLAVIAGNYIYGKEVVGLQALEALNVQSDLLTIISGWNDGTFKKELEQRNIAYRIIKLGWIYITKPLWTLDSLIHMPGAWLSYLKIKKEFQPDTIYTDSYRNVILLWPFLKEKSVVLHVHDEHAALPRDKAFIQRVAPKVKKYIAVSEFIKRDLEQCGVNSSDIDVVYNAINNVPNGKKEYMPDGVLRIGIVGQIVEKKGHRDLIRALGQLREKIDFHLYISGTGEEAFSSSLKQEIINACIESRVTWRGYVPDKADVYNQLDVVVVPSRIEPFGLVAAEAGMYYCPAIVANTGGLTEIVADGVSGYVFPKENVASLADKLMKIYNPDILRRMGTEGRRLVEGRFGQSIFREQVVASIIKKNF